MSYFYYHEGGNIIEEQGQFPVEIADKIVKMLHQVTGENVNFMGEGGVIIATMQPKRLGRVHEGAQRIMSGEIDELAISLEDAKKLQGTLPGYNGVVIYKGKRMGCIGLSGDPQKMRPLQQLATIIVGNLDKQFDTSVKDSNRGVTAADKEVVANGGCAEIKFTAEKKAESDASHASDISATASSNGKKVGMYLDLSVTKTVTGSTAPTSLVELPTLIEILIPLDTTLQGKSDYVIYRYHGTGVDTITTSPNADGEKIEMIDNNKTIRLFVKKFSTYAIAYKVPTGGGTTGGGSTGGGSKGDGPIGGGPVGGDPIGGGPIGGDPIGGGSTGDGSTHEYPETKNQKPINPAKKTTKNPQTGDSTPFALPLMATLGLAMLILEIYLKGKAKQKD